MSTGGGGSGGGGGGGSGSGPMGRIVDKIKRTMTSEGGVSGAVVVAGGVIEFLPHFSRNQSKQTRATKPRFIGDRSGSEPTEPSNVCLSTGSVDPSKVLHERTRGWDRRTQVNGVSDAARVRASFDHCRRAPHFLVGANSNTIFPPHAKIIFG